MHSLTPATAPSGTPVLSGLIPEYLDCTSMASAVDLARLGELVLIWWFGLFSLYKKIIAFVSSSSVSDDGKGKK